MILNMAKFTKLQELLQLMNNGDRNTFTSNKMLQSIGNRLLIDVMSWKGGLFHKQNSDLHQVLTWRTWSTKQHWKQPSTKLLVLPWSTLTLPGTRSSWVSGFLWKPVCYTVCMCVRVWSTVGRRWWCWACKCERSARADNRFIHKIQLYFMLGNWCVLEVEPKRKSSVCLPLSLSPTHINFSVMWWHGDLGLLQQVQQRRPRSRMLRPTSWRRTMRQATHWWPTSPRTPSPCTRSPSYREACRWDTWVCTGCLSWTSPSHCLWGGWGCGGGLYSK